MGVGFTKNWHIFASEDHKITCHSFAKLFSSECDFMLDLIPLCSTSKVLHTHNPFRLWSLIQKLPLAEIVQSEWWWFSSSSFLCSIMTKKGMSSVHPPITKLDFMGSNLDPFQISARLFQNLGWLCIFCYIYV